MTKLIPFLLAILFIGSTAPAQTLKWTYTLTPPTTFQPDNPQARLAQLRSDTLGNVAFLVLYDDSDLGPQRLLWLTARGKLLNDAALTSERVVNILSVSPSSLLALIVIQSPQPSVVLRRYQLKRGRVTATDTPFAGGVPVSPPNQLIRDFNPAGGWGFTGDGARFSTGFFSVIYANDDIPFVSAINSYSNK